jgi:hypothetical protein
MYGVVLIYIIKKLLFQEDAVYFWTRGEFSARTPTFREELQNLFALVFCCC